MSEQKGTHWREIETPALVVDSEKMAANIRNFHNAVLSQGTALRSHVKTHKSVDIVQMQLESGARGIAAAKLSEAEVFIEAGVSDVVVAYPIFGNSKFAGAADLASRCDRFVVHVENAPAIGGLSAAAEMAGVEIGLRVEIDSGFHRTGVDAEGAIELGRLIEESPGVYLDGITSHRSMFFPDARGRSPDELGILEGEFMVEVAERLRDAGLTVNEVIAGSTPTGRALATVDGITEVCAGTYVFYDAGMADLGIASHNEVALTAVGTVVVSHQSSEIYTIDAGAKTLTKDSYPGDGPRLYGRRQESSDVVVAVTDEHGIVKADGPKPDLGEVVRILPMHVCPTVNLTDQLTVLSGDHVVDLWPVSARGRTK